MSKSINRYIELQGGFAFKSSDFIESGIPLIRISNITKDGLNKTDAKLLPIEYQSELKEYLVLENDTLIAMSGATTGKSCIVKKGDLPCLINQRVGRFKIINEQEIDKTFVFYVVNSSEFQNELLKDAVGGAQPNVSPKQIEKISWDFPLYNKQRKIAQILSTADTVIEKTQTAIAKYKAIKQGMLHDLFTRGIDVKTGKLRPKYGDAPDLYKESKLGWIPKEWEEKPLQEFTTQIGDGIHSTPKYSSNTDFHFINGNNLSKGEILIGAALCVDEDEYKKHFKELNTRTILYSINGTIGNIAIYNNQKVILGKSACYITCKPSVNLEYIFFILQSFQISKFYELEMTGSTISNLSLTSIRNTPILIPQDAKEQLLISERINSVNNKLKSEQTYLQKLQMLKSGLMNELLSGKKLVSVPNELETETTY